ncbi:MAG: hypothetical protein EOO11_11500 [Chitinophagaceae bacterium]|nr:MAG: hypothetical protein EOO11_11500 [Chitinophagaceae bacterium]
MNRLLFLTWLLVLAAGCSTRRDYGDMGMPSDLEQRLQRGAWRYRSFLPGAQDPDPYYSMYHHPPGESAQPVAEYSLSFLPDHRIAYYPNRGQQTTWHLDPGGRFLRVEQEGPGGHASEIWQIVECSDTLLNVQVRAGAEPADTENYWGFKYRP